MGSNLKFKTLKFEIENLDVYFADIYLKEKNALYFKQADQMNEEGEFKCGVYEKK